MKYKLVRYYSIKTGNCPEDCGYCSQSGHYRDKTGLDRRKAFRNQKVLAAARRAKSQGSSRFCMGAAWKHPSEKDMPYLVDLISEVKAMGLETCMTLGYAKARTSQNFGRCRP